MPGNSLSSDAVNYEMHSSTAYLICDNLYKKNLEKSCTCIFCLFEKILNSKLHNYSLSARKVKAPFTVCFYVFVIFYFSNVNFTTVSLNLLNKSNKQSSKTYSMK